MLKASVLIVDILQAKRYACENIVCEMLLSFFALSLLYRGFKNT